MSDFDPGEIKNAVETSTGIFEWLRLGAVGTAFSTLVGVIYTSQNSKINANSKRVEKLEDAMLTVAKKEDIENIYRKIDANHESTVDRIIKIVREHK